MMLKFWLFAFLLLAQQLSAQYKITTISDLGYNLRYKCEGLAYDTTTLFPFDLGAVNSMSLSQLANQQIPYKDACFDSSMSYYNTCKYLYLDSIRGEVDIMTDFPQKINFEDVYALIQKDSFWKYNRYAGIEIITSRISYRSKQWKMNAMSKIAYAQQLTEKLLPKSSPQTRRLVLALALSPSVAYYKGFGVKNGEI